MILRLTKSMEDRDTLVACDACGGKGSRIEEDDKGRYKQVNCNWCQEGFTDRQTAYMFLRWKRILRANRPKQIA
jgi:hypothetical protein